jgi:hypothetical protein
MVPDGANRTPAPSCANPPALPADSPITASIALADGVASNST